MRAAYVESIESEQAREIKALREERDELERCFQLYEATVRAVLDDFALGIIDGSEIMARIEYVTRDDWKSAA